MTKPATAWTDQRLDQILGNLLRAGVLLAAAVILLGGVLYLVQHGNRKPDYETFDGEPRSLRSLTEVVERAFAGDSRYVIQLGVLLLIATPVARVLFSVFAFLLQRDWVYVVVTVIVLGVLLYSLFAEERRG
jgi:uncharacterized membrane protein